MLGLSNGITTSSAPSTMVLLETYTADWSSDADGWVSFSGNDSAATLTHGITFEGKSNTLRVQFNTDPEETGSCGISKPDAFSTTIKAYDICVVTFDIYLDSAYDSTGDGSDDLTDLWEGTDSVTVQVGMVGGRTDAYGVNQNQWASLDSEGNAPQDLDTVNLVPTENQLEVLFSSTVDSPQNGARFYIHNYVAKLYRSTIFA